MSTIEVKFSIPEPLAGEAKESGLLEPETLQNILRAEIRRRQVDRLFETADRLAEENSPPLTEAEIEAEIQAARKSRR